MTEQARCFKALVSVVMSERGQESKASPESESPRGYFRNFGITAPSGAAAQAYVEREILDGVVDWSDSEIVEISVDQALALAGSGASTAAHALSFERAGVWYCSGRAFY